METKFGNPKSKFEIHCTGSYGSVRTTNRDYDSCKSVRHHTSSYSHHTSVYNRRPLLVGSILRGFLTFCPKYSWGLSFMKGFTSGNDNPQFEGVITTPVKENNGVFSYAVQVSKEDATKISELFSQTECENEKLLYGQEGNLIYVRASKLGTYPDGCDYKGKVYLSIRLQENGWLQPICFATETAKAKADAEKVANQNVIKKTATTVKTQSRAYGLDEKLVGQLTLAAQLGFGAADFAKAITLLAEKPAPKKGQVNATPKATPDNDVDDNEGDYAKVNPADIAGGENSNP